MSESIDIAALRQAEAAARTRYGAAEPMAPQPLMAGRRFSVPSPDVLADNERKLEERARSDRRSVHAGVVARALEGLPEAFAGLTLDSEELCARVGAAVVSQTRAALPAPGIVWTGPSGAGKTSIACAAVRAWVESRGNGLVKVVDAHELAYAYARHPLGSQPPLIDDSMRADLLVIDDLGEEVPQPAGGDPIGVVVRHRYSRGATTWVTTGFGVQQIESKYGVAIRRRLYERAIVIFCAAPRR